MDNLMLAVCIFSSYRWLASIATLICTLCYFPNIGFCAADVVPSGCLVSDIFVQATNGDEGALVSKFDEIDQSLKTTDPLIQNGQELLQAFVDQVNLHYGLSLTLMDACQLIKEHAHLLQLSPEAEASILAAIDLLEKQNDLSQNSDPEVSVCECWHRPFGHKKDKHKTQELGEYPGPIPPDDGLPGNIPLGGCEMLCGALMCILPFPGCARIGVLLIGDGFRRVVDGNVQLQDERRNNPLPN